MDCGPKFTFKKIYQKCSLKELKHEILELLFSINQWPPGLRLTTQNLFEFGYDFSEIFVKINSLFTYEIRKVRK